MQEQDSLFHQTHLRALISFYAGLDNRYPTDHYWLKNAGLACILYQDSLAPELLPTLRLCLSEAPVEMPPVLFETFSEVLLREIEADTNAAQLTRQVEYYTFWENLVLNSAVLFPELQHQGEQYRIRMGEALQSRLPDCETLEYTYGEALNRDLLQPENYRFVYTALRLRGCSPSAFRDSIYNRYPGIAQTPEVYRIVAEEAAGRGDYLNALRWLERAAAAEPLARFQARDFLRLAQVYQARQNFRTARLYVERADESYPDWGYPYLFLAEMVVQSGPFCNFSPMEQKGLNWLAIDYCEQAMNLNPDLQPQAIRQIQRYQKNMPDRAEVLFYGFQIGDSFPLRCWLETATRVRYN